MPLPVWTVTEMKVGGCIFYVQNSMYSMCTYCLYLPGLCDFFYFFFWSLIFSVYLFKNLKDVRSVTMV